MHLTKLSYPACRAILAWITFALECCSVKCLCYAVNLKESKLDDCSSHWCSFYIFGLASLVSAEPVTMGPCCILFFSGSRSVSSHSEFCSHIKCTAVPCTDSFLAENICVALCFHGGREGTRNFTAPVILK